MSVSYNSSIVTNGLVLCLDAGNPRSYPGSGTLWNDVSGTGTIGTLINGPTYNSANLGSIVFDGIDDFVNSPATKTASCSFCCWAKTSSVATNPMLFNAGPNGQGPDLFFYNNKISWNVWDGDGSPFGTMPASVTDGNWHYYVVLNDSASTAKLYYDNVLLGSTTYRNASGNTNLTVGGNDAGYQWAGNISNFLMYNRVISVEEITQNFNALRGRYGI